MTLDIKQVFTNAWSNVVKVATQKKAHYTNYTAVLSHCKFKSSQNDTKMMKLLALLLLISTFKGETHECTQHPPPRLDRTGSLPNCGEGKRFMMTKSNNHYQLKLCTSSNHCTTQNYNFIERDDVCDFCEKLPGAQKGQVFNYTCRYNTIANDHYECMTQIAQMIVGVNEV